MLRRQRVSLLCPRNDLESDTIIRIAERLSIDTREVVGEWGLTLDEALRQHPNLETLRDQVIVVELPGTVAQAMLEAAGKQVHVIDHHGPETNQTRSSLEQFAELVGYELTTAEYEVAIADRDFFPGLSRAGVTFERAMALRQMESAIRSDAALVEEARVFVRDNARKLEHLTLYLAPLRLANVLLEAAQTPSKDDYTKAADQRLPVKLPEVLAVFHDDADRNSIRAVRFSGRAASRLALESPLSDPELRNGLELWLGGGRHGCFFGANVRKGYPNPPIDRLVSRLFALIGATSRPLRHYGCTFFLPLDLHEESELADNPNVRADRFRKILERKVRAGEIIRHRLDPVRAGELIGESTGERYLESQAHLYFLPLLRDVLFDVKSSGCSDAADRSGIACPIQRWRLHQDFIENLRWRLFGPRGDKPGPEAIIRDVSLYRYFNDLYLLAIRVEPVEQAHMIEGAEGLISDHEGWWHPLFQSSPQVFNRIKQLQLEHWLRFTKHARIVYPNFIEQLGEGKFDAQGVVRNGEGTTWFQSKDNVSPIVRDLLGRFLSDDPERPEQIKVLERLLRHQNLSEERMLVNVAYGLAGPPPTEQAEQEEADRLFSLALYVDRGADTCDALGGYVYDPAYTKTLTRNHSLDRWHTLGTQLGYGPYSNAYLGFGSFFCGVIAPEHVPYHYERMLILAIFYQLTLRNYNRRIAYSTRLLPGDAWMQRDPGLHFRRLRRGFIEFTNRYWFLEVTPAIQGKEVFMRQTAALELKREYDEAKEEMERADEYVQTLKDYQMNHRMSVAGWIALIIAGFGMALPLLEYEQSWQRGWWTAMVSALGVLVYVLYRRLRTVGESRSVDGGK
ncbi:Membrane protein [Thiocapsa sp. KS1]|nr:hypothetical protein [Thiocapsa sp. KS1]CRI67876.1 Membrane protein [Thiocapsa sp. KS1]